MRLQFLLTALAAVAVAQDTQTTAYTDPSTGITFQSTSPSPSFRLGFALPTTPSPDLLLQIITPLSSTSSGWGGIVLGASMRGPLQLVAWPGSSNRVMIAPRISTSYAVDGTKPYTANPITISPIEKGTFINATHLSATFVCGGCINSDSFDPAKAEGDQMFAFAYSGTAVKEPGNEGTLLSSHVADGDSGRFAADVKGARSEQFGEWVKLAAAEGNDGETTTPKPTETGSGGGQPQKTREPGNTGGSTPAHDGTSDADMDYRRMPAGAVAALALAGILYFLGALNVY